LANEIDDADLDDNDEDNPDDASPDGKSQGEGKSPGKGYVKTSQLIAAIKSATETAEAKSAAQIQALERQVKELAADKAKPAPDKVVTKEELRSLVQSGDLTQAQMDDLWEKQIIKAATAAATKQVSETVAAGSINAKINEKMAEYKTLVPDGWKPGSADYGKIETAYNELVADGSPPTIATELAALRMVYGSIESLRIAKTARKGSADSHVETNGSGRADDDSSGDEKGMPKGLSAAQKKHYQKGIDQGRYPGGWADVKAELKFARDRART
jgi:hypothetical protein